MFIFIFSHVLQAQNNNNKIKNKIENKNSNKLTALDLLTKWIIQR